MGYGVGEGSTADAALGAGVGGAALGAGVDGAALGAGVAAEAATGADVGAASSVLPAHPARAAPEAAIATAEMTTAVPIRLAFLSNTSTSVRLRGRGVLAGLRYV